MNLLETALAGIQGLISNQSISICSKKQVIEDGFPKTTSKTIDTFAHIQPLGSSQRQMQDGLFVNAEISYKFYIVGNLAEVGDFLQNQNATILWNGVEYEIFAKENWTQNGWIKVMGSQKGGENV